MHTKRIDFFGKENYNEQLRGTGLNGGTNIQVDTTLRVIQCRTKNMIQNLHF